MLCNERDQLRNDNTEKVRVLTVSLKEYKQLQVASQNQTEKAKRLWRMRCEQMLTYI